MYRAYIKSLIIFGLTIYFHNFRIFLQFITDFQRSTEKEKEKDLNSVGLVLAQAAQHQMKARPRPRAGSFAEKPSRV
jgi:hypothetical protein